MRIINNIRKRTVIIEGKNMKNYKEKSKWKK